MNINRITKYRALILAAEAGALNVKASTPEEEARVSELIIEAENILKERPVASPLLDQMLTGPHWSDAKSPQELFPDIEFDCYRDVPSTCKSPGTWGKGWTGDEICARALARYRDATQNLSFKESMTLLAHLMSFFDDHHANTGIGDTEPQYMMTDAVNGIFSDLGFKSISRNEWNQYLIRHTGAAKPE